MVHSRRVLVFNSCCGCASLRTGCFIIGYLLLAVYTPAVSVLFLMMVYHIVDFPVFNYPHKNFWIFTMAPLVFTSVVLAFAIVLLVGLHKRKRRYLLSFLIAIGIVCVLSFIALILAIMYERGPFLITTRFIFLMLDLLYFIFVRSYYYKMADADANT